MSGPSSGGVGVGAGGGAFGSILPGSIGVGVPSMAGAFHSMGGTWHSIILLRKTKREGERECKEFCIYIYLYYIG